MPCYPYSEIYNPDGSLKPNFVGLTIGSSFSSQEECNSSCESNCCIRCQHFETVGVLSCDACPEGFECYSRGQDWPGEFVCRYYEPVPCNYSSNLAIEAIDRCVALGGQDSGSQCPVCTSSSCDTNADCSGVIIWGNWTLEPGTDGMPDVCVRQGCSTQCIERCCVCESLDQIEFSQDLSLCEPSPGVQSQTNNMKHILSEHNIENYEGK